MQSNANLPETHRFSPGDQVQSTAGFHAVVENTEGENVRVRTEDGLQIVLSAWALWRRVPLRAKTILSNIAAKKQ